MAIKMRKKAKSTVKKVVKKEITTQTRSSSTKAIHREFTFPKTS